ncbi:MAG: rRNA adenine N-6-methyltransferase family protein [Saprospiraceae bacterium]
MSTLSFLRAGIKSIRTTGTITRSSPALCRAAIEAIDFERARTIIELGAGDGVITEHILQRLHPDGKVIAFEVDRELCNDMRRIGDPRLIVAEDSAEHQARYLAEIGQHQADYIVSALPYAALPPELGKRIVAESARLLRPGGVYSQVHYSLKTKSFYADAFGNVAVRFVPWNLPPAFVLTSHKH